MSYDPKKFLWSIEHFGDFKKTQAKRRAIFSRIKPKGDWKGEIRATITKKEFQQCADACIWFTGGALEIVRRTINADGEEVFDVRSGGYYENIGS